MLSQRVEQESLRVLCLTRLISKRPIQSRRKGPVHYQPAIQRYAGEHTRYYHRFGALQG
jgi:hypothetical protein